MKIIAVILLLCAAARGSITYTVDINTNALPFGNYQAAFFLIDPSAPDNWSQTPLADSISIDGTIITDSTHYFAGQPVIDVRAGEWPLNFNITLSGSPGCPDYFFMAMRTPDGGIIDGTDGNQWLLSAVMGTDSPVLNHDMPQGMTVTSASVPESGAISLLLLCMAHFLLSRRRFSSVS